MTVAGAYGTVTSSASGMERALDAGSGIIRSAPLRPGLGPRAFRTPRGGGSGRTRAQLKGRPERFAAGGDNRITDCALGYRTRLGHSLGRAARAGKLGSYTVGDNGEVVLGPLFVLDQTNIDQFSF